MTDLYLFEIPNQARDIARVLGADQRRAGYFEGQNVIVTWCFEHLLEMAAPENYHSELKQWHWKVRKAAKQQYTVIVQLFKTADSLVIATDADREGEAIARQPDRSAVCRARSKAQAFKGVSSTIKQYDCPECNHTLVRRKSKNGFFWGCRNYPDCTVTVPDDTGKPGKLRSKPPSTGDNCPECGNGERVKRTIRKGQRRGQTFIGCSRYPDCTYAEFI